MLEILTAFGDLLGSVGTSLWLLGAAVLSWGYDVLYYLHTEAPRLEGLLIGVALAWLLLRRDKHPLLRVLSAPLKLVVDILDLAWDQVVEVASDLWGTVTGWVTGSLGWVRAKIKSVWDWNVGILKKSYTWVIEKLKSLKNRLSKKEE